MLSFKKKHVRELPKCNLGPSLYFHSHQCLKDQQSLWLTISKIPQHCCEQNSRNSSPVYSERKYFIKPQCLHYFAQDFPLCPFGMGVGIQKQSKSNWERKRKSLINQKFLIFHPGLLYCTSIPLVSNESWDSLKSSQDRSEMGDKLLQYYCSCPPTTQKEYWVLEYSQFMRGDGEGLISAPYKLSVHL